MLVGDGTDGCGRTQRAAAYRIRNDGSVQPLWRDASPYETSARGIRRAGGMLEIVGYAARWMAAPRQPALRGDVTNMRQGDEAYVSGEIFSVTLSEQGVEQRRDFVGAGLPVVPAGLASMADHNVIFGSVGSRALWMAR